MRVRAFVSITLLCLTVGCGDSVDDSPLNESTSSVASSSRVIPTNLVAPTQKNGTGLPTVPFDPCVDIDDSTIRSAGFDPSSRTRSDVIGDVFTLLGCQVDGEQKLITLLSGNEPFDDYRTRNGEGAQTISVNGREAFVGPNLINPDGCTLAMKTKYGVMVVDAINRTRVRLGGVPGCDRVPEIASLIEPLLPRGN